MSRCQGEGSAGARERGLPAPVPAMPCCGLPVPLSHLHDRGDDVCLVQGCAEEDFSPILPGGRSNGDGKRIAEIELAFS